MEKKYFISKDDTLYTFSSKEEMNKFLKISKIKQYTYYETIVTYKSDYCVKHKILHKETFI